MLQQLISCPCGSAADYNNCCGAFISGKANPESPEQLMRSRYTAYVIAAGDYLYRTQHPDYRSSVNAELLTEAAQQLRWQRLEIISATGDADAQDGEVEFKAWYVQNNRAGILHERSRFLRVDGQWLYTDGDNKHKQSAGQNAAAQGKIGRNHPCPCGSGKKYKKCCALRH